MTISEDQGGGTPAPKFNEFLKLRRSSMKLSMVGLKGDGGEWFRVGGRDG